MIHDTVIHDMYDENWMKLYFWNSFRASACVNANGYLSYLKWLTKVMSRYCVRVCGSVK